MTMNELKWSRTVIAGGLALVSITLVALYVPADVATQAFMAITSVMGVVAGRQTPGKEP